MKILLDQNISYRVLKKIEHLFPEAAQVKRLGLINATDKMIWQFAKEQDYAILTHDADFQDLSLLYGYPPKIIWLREGNLTNEMLAQKLLNAYDTIKSFIQEDLGGCLQLF